MGKSSPKTPDPTTTAAAQTGANKDTAYYNALLQNMNQYTPYGSLTYQFNGNKDNPRWTSTVKLSPEQQKLYNTQTSSQNALAQLGYDQLGRISDSVSKPYSYSGLPEVYSANDLSNFSTNAENAIYSRLDPKFAQEEEALRTRLVNQGITQGSEAYRREMEAFNQSKNDARLQTVLAGQQYGTNMLNNSLAARQQAISDYAAQRNAPLNEYSALTSGTQITNPTFSSGGNTGISSPDIAGMINNNYNQKVAQNNATTSGLFGLGGTALGGFLGSESGGSWLSGLLGSDIRIKENIEFEGNVDGFNYYKFNYKGYPDQSYVGVMAQEVMESHPGAVHDMGGYLAVDYDALGIKMREVDNG